MKLTYGHLNDFKMVQALQKLYESPITIKTAYKIGKIRKAVQKEVLVGRDMYHSFRTKYALEGGVLDQSGYIEVDPAKKEAFEKEALDFFALEFEIQQHKITLFEIKDVVGISAHDLSSLEPLLEDEPESSLNDASVVCS